METTASKGEFNVTEINYNDFSCECCKAQHIKTVECEECKCRICENCSHKKAQKMIWAFKYTLLKAKYLYKQFAGLGTPAKRLK